MSSRSDAGVQPERVLRAAQAVSVAAGAGGMVGGQALTWNSLPARAWTLKNCAACTP